VEILSGLDIFSRRRVKHRMALDAESNGCGDTWVHRGAVIYGWREWYCRSEEKAQRLVAAEDGKTTSLAAELLSKSGRRSVSLADELPANF